MSDTATLERALGWSLMLAPIDPIDGAAGGLDLEFTTVSGEAALMQALTLAFVTLRGSDVFNSGFGFSGIEAMTLDSDAVIRRERIRMAVIGVLQAEPRIQRIVTVRFADEAGADRRTPQSTPPTRTVPIEAVFETVGGVRKQIVLGGEVLDVR